MRWSLVRLGQTGDTPVDPVSLAEAKAWLRVDHSEEDLIISALISSSTRMAEDFMGRAIMRQRLKLSLDCFPEVIELPMAPVSSVTNVKYLDAAGELQTLDASLYVVDTEATPPRIIPAYSQTWPSTRDTINAVRIEYVAGYGETQADIPETIRMGILIAIVHIFDNRHDDNVFPSAGQSTLRPFRVWF
jgi:uncharacterized phiE125 gp8 family phage protein